jgi:hypothetical protein
VRNLLALPIGVVLALTCAAPGARADVVTPDDGIFQGNLCAGIDCVNGESFGFDVLRLKANNTRIGFDDTSSGVGFPANDWAIAANDTGSGGASFLSFEDVTGAKVPFKVLAGAPTDSLRVDPTGKLGLGTASPALKASLKVGDTPGVRLEQDATSGFTAQTWDVAGNEANFFVRDVTGGSRLPFRIRPGAPTSAIDIAASGNVGVGTASPASRLDVRGAITQSADPAGSVSENTATVDGPATLTALRTLPLGSREYVDDATNAKHLWPTGHDFFTAFGLGTDTPFVSPTDMAGVALVAIQALDARVSALPLAKGDKGDTGAPGSTGANGTNGAPGSAGTPANTAALLTRLIKLEKTHTALAKRVTKLEKRLRRKSSTPAKAATPRRGAVRSVARGGRLDNGR